MPRCRSSAPGMRLPQSLIDCGDFENVSFMLLYSFPEHFDLELAVHAKEPNEPIPAEDGCNCLVAGTLQTLLKLFVNAGRTGRSRPSARMAVKMGQETMTEQL